MTKPASSERDLSRLAQSIRELWEGRGHSSGTVTLTAGATSTTVSAANCGPNSRVLLTALTANAAAALATTYISATTTGSFTITHANNAQTDRTFNYAFKG